MKKIYLRFSPVLFICFFLTSVLHSQNSLSFMTDNSQTDSAQMLMPKLSLTKHPVTIQTLKSNHKAYSLLIPATEKSRINPIKFGSLVAVTVGASIGLHQL